MGRKKRYKKHPKLPRRAGKTARAAHPARFRARLLKGLSFMLLAGFFTLVLNRAGLLSQLETTFLDAQMRLDVPEQESPVVIIDITQGDFERDFQGQTRPLKPEALWSLISAVAKGRPCVIGVDIDTHFPQLKDFKVAEDWPPVIWAREVADLPADGSQKLVPLGVLGGQSPSLDGKSGIPLLIEDAGSGTARLYVRMVETTLGTQPSFPWAVYKESRSLGCAGAATPAPQENTEPLLIRYSRGSEGVGRTRLTASNVTSFAHSAGWQNNDLLRGKIVLIGGSYLGEDRHNTPLGRLTGVEVMANIVEGELRGGGIRPPNNLTIGLLLLFDGFILIALFQLLSFRRALLVSPTVILLLSLACSFLTYRSFSRWAFFAPVLLGVTFAELFDMVKDIYKGWIGAAKAE